MQKLTVFLLLALAAVSCSAELAGDQEEPHSLVKRKINCPPMAICLPASTPPPIREQRSADLAADDELYTNPIFQTLSGHRQKRGSKPVPIIACNRKTGKCRRI